MKIVKSIRVESEAFKKIKVQAAREGKTVGELLGHMINNHVRMYDFKEMNREGV